MAMAMVLIRASHGHGVAERRGRWSWYDGDDDGDDDGDYDGTSRSNIFFHHLCACRRIRFRFHRRARNTPPRFRFRR